MARLRSELQRLFLPHTTEATAASATESTLDIDRRLSSLIDGAGLLRAMVLEVGSSVGWEPTSAVWRGVQRELELPAPAIAVSGRDGFQLWFSLAEAVPMAQAEAFLKALQARFLADIAPRHVRLMPGADSGSPQSLHQEHLVPAQQASGNWSAFVSPDLAPIFVETPWLDITPSDDGQADLLRSIRSIQRAEWMAALEQLGLLLSSPSAVAASDPQAAALGATGVMAAMGAETKTLEDPRQFLLKVMNDETVALALRIESAKALLQFPEGGAGKGQRA